MRRTIFFGAAAFLAGVAFFGAVFLTAVFVAGAFVLNMMIVESRRGVPHTAPHAVASVPPSVSIERPVSIDRWNTPIGTDGIPKNTLLDSVSSLFDSILSRFKNEPGFEKIERVKLSMIS